MQKKIIILALVMMLLGGYIFFFENPFQESKQQQEDLETLLYDSFKEKHIYYINITNQGETVNLERKGEDWILVNANYPADQTAVQTMIDLILNLNKGQMISNNPQNWSKFEVTKEKAVEVQIKEKENREIAHFFIGKMGPTYASQYVRKNNLDEVYLVNQNLTMAFTRPLSAWKDHTILTLDPATIKSVQVVDQIPAQTDILIQSGSGWTLNGTELSSAQKDAFFTEITNLKTNDFPLVENFDLNSKTAQYIIQIQLNSDSTKIIYLFPIPESEDYYLILEGNQTLFQIDKTLKDRLTFLDLKKIQNKNK